MQEGAEDLYKIKKMQNISLQKEKNVYISIRKFKSNKLNKKYALWRYYYGVPRGTSP